MHAMQILRCAAADCCKRSISSAAATMIRRHGRLCCQHQL
jgi:hypothetical protein